MSAKTRTPADAVPGGIDALKGSVGGLAHALGGRAVDAVASKAGAVTKRLTDYAEGTPSESPAASSAASPAMSAAAAGTKTLAEGGSKLKAGAASAAAAVKGKVQDMVGGGGSSGAPGGGKFINIVESADVGAPVDVVYNAWTEYERWPDFMRKLESASLDAEEGRVRFAGKVFLSHRKWEASIVDQIATRRVVWESTGEKGTLSGAVTFHALADDLTRIVVVVEYRPRGFVEKVANVWRPVGRRLRLELKFFVHHVMTDVVLHPDDLEGYRAEIQDQEVVRSHDEVVEEESQGEEPESEEEEPQDEAADEERGNEEPADGEPEDEEPADEGEEEPEAEAPRRQGTRSRKSSRAR